MRYCDLARLASASLLESVGPVISAGANQKELSTLIMMNEYKFDDILVNSSR